MELPRCLKVLVSGHVQGVCFRQYTHLKALELGITGWVRNLPNGDVEALICGGSTQLDSMLVWLAHGPDSAQVAGIRSSPHPCDLIPDSFRISH